MSVEKYNSFLLAVYIFNSMLTLFFKIVGLPSSFTTIVFIFLSIPLIFNCRNIPLILLLIPLFIVSWVVFSVLIADVEIETVIYTSQLIMAFGVIASLVSAMPINEHSLSKYMKLFAAINFLMLAYLVLFRQDLYLNIDVMNYMTYGYWMLTSSLVFAHFYCRDNDIFMLLLTIVSGIFIFSFGSRFGLVCFVIGTFCLYLYSHGLSKRVFILICLLLVVSTLIVVNLKLILLYMLNIAESYEIVPTSLYRLLKLVNDGFATATSSRDNLYMTSLQIIQNNPIGLGIYGYYRELLDGATGLFRYPHNIVLQFLLEYGIYGTSIIILFFVVITYLNLRLIEPTKGWLFVLLMMINIKLLVTGSYLWEPAFWMSLTIGVKNILEYKKMGRCK